MQRRNWVRPCIRYLINYIFIDVENFFIGMAKDGKDKYEGKHDEIIKMLSNDKRLRYENEDD